MDQPPPLNNIRLGNEWLVTNGHLAPDGTIRFPEDDPAEELFNTNEIPPCNFPAGNLPPEKPATPPTEP